MQFVVLFQDCEELTLKLTGGQAYFDSVKTLSMPCLDCIFFCESE
jgi:hypothetical protein